MRGTPPCAGRIGSSRRLLLVTPVHYLLPSCGLITRVQRVCFPKTSTVLQLLLFNPPILQPQINSKPPPRHIPIIQHPIKPGRCQHERRENQQKDEKRQGGALEGWGGEKVCDGLEDGLEEGDEGPEEEEGELVEFQVGRIEGDKKRCERPG